MNRKDELRKAFKEKRNALTMEEQNLLNTALLDQFKMIDLSGVHFMHIYLPIVRHREPDTRPLIDYISTEYPSIKLVVSRSEKSDFLMKHFLLDADTVLEDNLWGIPEPTSGHEVDADKLDLVVVPLLAYDRNGNRVGYGKGFYDRFLADCRPDVKKIGLSFFDPVEEIVDVHVDDICLDMLVSPTKIYYYFK